MPYGGGGVPHRILLLLSCRAAGCMREHGRGRTFVLVVRAAGSCARRIDGGSCGPPVFDGEGGVWCPACPGHITREVHQTGHSHLWATGVIGVAA